jgi:hypothetical protein
LKNHKEAEKERSISRSRVSHEIGRRKSSSPSRNSAQKPSQIVGALIRLPPNAPSYPRAIFHATCGPVHASVTRPLRSSTRPSAICPASLSSLTFHQTFTSQHPPCVPAVHFAGSDSYVASVIRPRREYRSSQSATLSSRRKIAVARSFVRRGPAGAAANGVCTSRPFASSTGLLD